MYICNLPGAGGIQNLTEISPPLTVVKVAAPGPNNEPGHFAGLFNVRKQDIFPVHVSDVQRPIFPNPALQIDKSAA